jgi:hypothetical protein
MSAAVFSRSGDSGRRCSKQSSVNNAPDVVMILSTTTIQNGQSKHTDGMAEMADFQEVWR